MSISLTVDRIESGIATLIGREDERLHIALPLSELPAGSREGDVLILLLERDEPATLAAKEKVSGLIRKLQKK